MTTSAIRLPADLIRRAIVHEIYVALERLGASPELLGEFVSWGDTLDDEAVLESLRTFNERGTIFRE
jgi:hypothetical protein